MKPLNIGCLSSGKHATKNIIPMIINHEEFNLVLVHARDLNKLKDSLITARIFEESSDNFDLNKITCYEDDIYLNKNIDVVYISSPNALHFDQILKCLENNKHVIVEKTALTSINQFEQVKRLAFEKQLIVTEAFMYKFHNQLLKLKEEIEKIGIEEIRRIFVNFHIPHLEKNNIRYKKDLGGGALLDVGAYTLNILKEIGIAEPELIQSQIENDSNDLDIGGIATLKYKNILITCNWGFGITYKNSIEIITGDKIIFADRIFSKPKDLKTNILTYSNGNIINQNEIDPEDHFSKMFSNLFQDIKKLKFHKSIDQIEYQLKLIESIKNNETLY
tara:strand:+ start:64 stop:1062 length:999 start_codon:yes stop_codon:yes gene_type:complete